MTNDQKNVAEFYILRVSNLPFGIITQRQKFVNIIRIKINYLYIFNKFTPLFLFVMTTANYCLCGI